MLMTISPMQLRWLVVSAELVTSVEFTSADILTEELFAQTMGSVVISYRRSHSVDWEEVILRSGRS
jgi:hypothetical protein